MEAGAQTDPGSTPDHPQMGHRSTPDKALDKTTEETRPNLTAMMRLSPGQCLRVLGTFLQCDGGKDQEYSDMLEAAWKAYHAN